MADNVSITSGTGTVIAADDIGGVLHQRVKLTWGVDGSAVDASATNPLPITMPGANTNGRATASNSAPVVISSEDFAVLGAMNEGAPSSDTGAVGLNGRLQWLAKLTPTSLARNSPISGSITTAMTGTTSTSLIGAPGASLFNYITNVIVSNSHATVGTDIELQDGSGGTTFAIIPAAAVYNNGAITFPTPLKQPTANTALFVKNSVTGASTRVTAVGYKGA